MNTGGPAFPSDAKCDSWQCRKPSSGMTLLDWFAGKALEGMAASSYWAENVQGGRRDYLDPMAQSAYAMAEAMLAEKQRREGWSA